MRRVFLQSEKNYIALYTQCKQCLLSRSSTQLNTFGMVMVLYFFANHFIQYLFFFPGHLPQNTKNKRATHSSPFWICFTSDISSITFTHDYSFNAAALLFISPSSYETHRIKMFLCEKISMCACTSWFSQKLYYKYNK